ncbi:hypothetical protein CC78DRAFT_532324 [Lojkania enalia]|uniref:Uncharacterized protein n=1 Tax=Lojkania enalia TaxID=147567 RepID=A0A9P4KAE7_9PLEO|nr:hypothetical protein CC78DRAFT_532324 [Didymosphaeria enalia]
MKELEDAFEDFNVRSMRFLNGREPIKRTRVAEVYLYSKQSADRATRKIDHIFGLKIEVSRAVKSLLIPQGNRGGESCWSLPEVVMGAKSGETRMDE